jgi:SAM-dependent methyltransferase
VIKRSEEMMAQYEEFSKLELDGWTGAQTTDGYIDLFSPASDMAIPSLVGCVPTSSRVLDLCCGQGNGTEALLSAGHDVVSVDFSRAMLEHAQRRNPGVEFVEADAQDLPFVDRSFDAVVSNFGLVHVPDQPKALAEISRVLKPRGAFAMTTWCGPDISPAFQVFFSSVQEHGAPGVSLPDGPNFYQFAQEETARGLLDEAGMRLARIEQIECHWLLSAAEELFEIFRVGAPRAGYLLRQQPADNCDAIREAIVAKTRERFSDGSGYRVPIPAALIVAAKP